MSEVVELPEPSYFGDCPKCGTNDGVLNVGREHWFVCHKHKTKRHVGSNLFSFWREETEEDWEENFRVLITYKTVKSLNRWSQGRHGLIGVRSARKDEPEEGGPSAG